MENISSIASKTIIFADKVCDFVPFVSFANNLAAIVAKVALDILAACKPDAYESIRDTHLVIHLTQKDYLMCVALALPFYNILYAIKWHLFRNPDPEFPALGVAERELGIMEAGQKERAEIARRELDSMRRDTPPASSTPPPSTQPTIENLQQMNADFQQKVREGFEAQRQTTENYRQRKAKFKEGEDVIVKKLREAIEKQTDPETRKRQEEFLTHYVSTRAQTSKNMDEIARANGIRP